MFILNYIYIDVNGSYLYYIKYKYIVLLDYILAFHKMVNI